MKNNFSYRLANLGTETAFSVSSDATNFENEGNKVYPFHLGDINISTPENIIDARSVIPGLTERRNLSSSE